MGHDAASNPGRRVFLVYTPALDNLHAVSEHEFDSRIQLRVDDPEQADSSINWAEEYEFDRRWPLAPPHQH